MRASWLCRDLPRFGYHPHLRLFEAVREVSCEEGGVEDVPQSVQCAVREVDEYGFVNFLVPGLVFFLHLMVSLSSWMEMQEVGGETPASRDKSAEPAGIFKKVMQHVLWCLRRPRLPGIFVARLSCVDVLCQLVNYV